MHRYSNAATFDLRFLRCGDYDRFVESALNFDQELRLTKGGKFAKAADLGLRPRHDPGIAANNEFIMEFLFFVESPSVRDFVVANRDLIFHAHENYDSIMDLKRDLTNPEMTDRLESFALRNRLTGLVLRLILVPEVIADPDWLKLAKDPTRFNRELKSFLASLAALMKNLYGISSHRSRTNAERDREIWILKKFNPSLTFGQIGIKTGITDGASELAYKRQAKRERTRLRAFQQITAACFAHYQGDDEVPPEIDKEEFPPFQLLPPRPPIRVRFPGGKFMEPDETSG